MSKRLPKSIRKYIRKEKARIRREVFDLKEQEKLINQLYERIQPVKTYRISSGELSKEKLIKKEKPVKPKELDKKTDKPQKAKKEKNKTNKT